ncbi:hypothetical protein TWF481_002776 [Arthrobotrys musiformis]|uniref:Uncharacterized protein n=1 Tax=Arthrobotrys musiformis TaxID=47236 RepID=A0AAV9VRB8_9PEZI
MALDQFPRVSRRKASTTELQSTSAGKQAKMSDPGFGSEALGFDTDDGGSVVEIQDEDLVTHSPVSEPDDNALNRDQAIDQVYIEHIEDLELAQQEELPVYRKGLLSADKVPETTNDDADAELLQEPQDELQSKLDALPFRIQSSTGKFFSRRKKEGG